MDGNENYTSTFQFQEQNFLTTLRSHLVDSCYFSLVYYVDVNYSYIYIVKL